MNGTAIVKAAMADSRTTQKVLSERMGYAGQGTVSQRINTTRMSLDKFAEMLAVMGYEVVVQKVVRDEDGNVVERKDMWTVSAPEHDEED